MNRYATLEAHADNGIGADEEGMSRFTRPCERAERCARSEKEGDSAAAATADGVDVQIPIKESEQS